MGCNPLPSSIKKSKIGRPTKDTEPVTVRLPREMIDGLDEWRRQQPKIPTRPDAIREAVSDWLIALGLLKPPQ